MTPRANTVSQVRATARHVPFYRKISRGWLIANIVLLAIAVVGVPLFWLGSGPTGTVVSAREALTAGDFDRADSIARAVLRRQPRNAGALLIAGEVATKQDRWDEALRLYEQIPDDAGRKAAVGLSAAGDLLLQQGHALEAEKKFLRALNIEPDLTMACNRLAFLYSLVGRRWESIPYLLELVRRDQFSLDNLLLLGHRTVDVDLPDELKRYRDASPGDPLPLIGLAKRALREGQSDEALGLLRQVIAADPEQTEAQARLGELLLEAADEDGLAAWHRALPASAEVHPDVWVVLGSWARQQGQLEAAKRCCWEALVRDPNQQAANYQLGQLLAGDEPQVAQKFAQRAEQLQQLGTLLDLLYQRQITPEALRRTADLTESLGRIWEAWAWHRVAGTMLPNEKWPSTGLARLQGRLSPDLPLTLTASNPVNEIDLAAYPLPHSSSRPSKAALPSNVAFCFQDKAQDVGIDFTYFAAYRGQLTGRKMYQFTGGGVAVLDYDGDLWPDLYFTQGGDWPPHLPRGDLVDCLYRNHGGQRAVDVTSSARLVDEGFGQGATIGDYNSDGFADVYVANIGRNRLWMNCGDGTFLDATADAGLIEERWTTSCLLADLNADGLPDIYDVNYVQGADVFEKVCRIGDGLPGLCPPTAFEAQPDNYYLNLGDGRFSDVTATSGLMTAGGNGLGILAADFDHSGRLSLFVANDQDANFFFANRTSNPAHPHFAELGVLAGLAFGADGRAQASMGVAAGDANGDREIDLFVTNFYQEANALYLNMGEGLFNDEIDASGIRQSGYNMLGFGTQFIDGDLDGRPDLVVANGHIDDFTSRGTPYPMHPQFFHNLGGGRFAEVDFAACGDYFTRELVGRALARLDFNRDGRGDFSVSHLDSPSALVINHSPTDNHFLAIQLRGVQSARDAIGAWVTIEAGESRWSQQLTAGDGYHASNERTLIFGLGSFRDVDRLHIKWPNGGEQAFNGLQADQRLIVIENRNELQPF